VNNTKAPRLLLLVTAALSALGCKSKAPPDNPKPEVAMAAPTNDAAQGSAAAGAAFRFDGPGAHLVNAIAGFTITKPPRYFGPQNLYTLIDGGAEAYVSLGLAQMVTADYTSRDRATVTLTVEVYDMASPKNAERRYSKFLDGKEDPANAGKGLASSMSRRGILGTTSATFWKEKYLVNVTLLDESESATKETMAALGAELLPTFAKAIDETI
jgi:hypothetical protein